MCLRFSADKLGRAPSSPLWSKGQPPTNSARSLCSQPASLLLFSSIFDSTKALVTSKSPGCLGPLSQLTCIIFCVCSQTSHLVWEDKGKGKARAMDSDDTYRLDLGLAPRERGHFADTPQEGTTTSRRANPRVRSLDEASLAGLSGVPLPRPPLKFYLTTSNQSLWFWIPRKRISIAPFLSHSSSTSEILHTLQTNFIFLTWLD